MDNKVGNPSRERQGRNAEIWAHARLPEGRKDFYPGRNNSHLGKGEIAEGGNAKWGRWKWAEGGNWQGGNFLYLGKGIIGEGGNARKVR